MAIGVGGTLIAASWVVPIILHIYGMMQGDPEVDVQGALDQMGREQTGELEYRLGYETRKEAERQKEERSFMDDVMTKTTLVRSGFYDRELMGESEPGGLTEEAAGRLGMDPMELQERLNPRRLGDLSNLTQDALKLR